MLAAIKSQRAFHVKTLSLGILIGSCLASLLMVTPWIPAWIDGVTPRYSIILGPNINLGKLTRYEEESSAGPDKRPPVSSGRYYVKERMLQIYGIQLPELKARAYHNVAPFTFMTDYKNPCWLEHLPATYMAEYNATVHNQYARVKILEMAKVYERRLSRLSAPWRVRCLPYFYLLGVTKSGTSDLFDGLMRHPQVHGPWVKEPMYWNRHRYPKCAVVHKHQGCRHQRFSQYLNMFDYPAHVINQSRDVDASPPHQHIIGDGSSYLFWEDNAWENHPYNNGMIEPRFTTPMTLHTVQPKAKLIVLFRNPTDRVYSAYTMYTGTNNSAGDFDRVVRVAIQEYNDCFKRHGVRPCAYNVTLSRRLHPISLRGSMYPVFLKDWYNAFPTNQVLIIKSEDYYKDRMRYLLAVYRFLGLAPITDKRANKISQRKAVRVQQYAPMLTTTREHLNKFFKHFTNELYKMLKISW